MKTLRWILLILFIVALAAAIVVAATGLSEINELRAADEELEQQIEVTNGEVQNANMKYRGFLKSMETIPDSVRANQFQTIRQKGAEYRQRILNLEKQERDLKRKQRKNENLKSAVYAEMKRRLLVLGGGAVVLLLGTVLVSRAAIRS